MSAESPTVVARLTAPGRSAVATIRISGPGALNLVDKLFLPKHPRAIANDEPGVIRFGRWQHMTGEEVVVCRRAANAVEIHCHGGLAASEAIIGSLVSHGTTEIDWQSWIERDEPRPIEREALIALANATTERTAAILLAQLHGALAGECAAIEQLIAQLELGAAS